MTFQCQDCFFSLLYRPTSILTCDRLERINASSAMLKQRLTHSFGKGANDRNEAVRIPTERNRQQMVSLTSFGAILEILANLKDSPKAQLATLRHYLRLLSIGHDDILSPTAPAMPLIGQPHDMSMCEPGALGGPWAGDQ